MSKSIWNIPWTTLEERNSKNESTVIKISSHRKPTLGWSLHSDPQAPVGMLVCGRLCESACSDQHSNACKGQPALKITLAFGGLQEGWSTCHHLCGSWGQVISLSKRLLFIIKVINFLYFQEVCQRGFSKA